METGIKTPEPKLIFGGASEWIRGEPPKFIESPLSALNEIIVGLPESELVLIAGAPSQGKTALGMQIAASAAAEGQAVGVFSMEMSRKQLAERLACSALGIDSNRLRKRWKVPLTPEETQQLDELYAEQANLPIFVDDRGGLSIDKIYSAANTWKETHNIRAILLDYVQLIEGGQDRQEAIGQAARTFKIIAKELQVPFIALSQINRAIDNRENRTPRMSDLRDSGQLEQVADIIMMFSYPNSPDDDVDPLRECQIHVKKNRNGPTGVAHVQFNKARTKFEPLDPTEIELVRSQSTDTPKTENKKVQWKRPAEPEQTEPT